MAIICVFGFILFSILGIFSSYYRKLAKEAFLCAIGKTVGKKCEAELNKKVKAKILAKLYKISPKIAKLISKHFILFSYIFIILILLSSFLIGSSFYNYYKYGNCNGENSKEYCVINDVLEDNPINEIRKDLNNKDCINTTEKTT